MFCIHLQKKKTNQQTKIKAGGKTGGTCNKSIVLFQEINMCFSA